MEVIGTGTTGLVAVSSMRSRPAKGAFGAHARPAHGPKMEEGSCEERRKSTSGNNGSWWPQDLDGSGEGRRHAPQRSEEQVRGSTAEGNLGHSATAKIIGRTESPDQSGYPPTWRSDIPQSNFIVQSQLCAEVS